MVLNVQVEVAIAIVVGPRRAAAVACTIPDAGRAGHVGEGAIAVVPVKDVGAVVVRGIQVEVAVAIIVGPRRANAVACVPNAG